MDRLLTLSGIELARLIRTREVSSREVVDRHIRRAEQVQPRLNALAVNRFQEARGEADAADSRLSNGGGEVPPLLGVPCTVKESIAFAGMPHTSGLVARRDVVAAEDAVAVANLRASGAICIGVTNISELCMWMETFNKVYGRTNNPYDPKRTVGGSSGGEGAVVGAGATPFGLGADVGGSIRMPAFFNGVFGHKPTGGTVPTLGHHPPAENEIQRYNTFGPLARRAEDLMPLLQIFAGKTLGDPARVTLGQLTVYDAQHDTAPEMRRAMDRAVDALRATGASVEPLERGAFKHGFDIWSALMDDAGGTSFAEHLGNGRATRAGREFLRWLVGRSPHTLPAIGLAAVEKLPGLLRERANKAITIGRALKRDLAEQLGPRGVMIYPSFPRTAPRHYRLLLTPHYAGYTGLFNVLEFPVTQVPMGLSSEGLPVGVQVVGAPGNDHVTIAVAMELERACGGWVPPLL